METKLQTVADIRENVNSQLQRLSSRVPTYGELSDEAKAVVDNYLQQLDVANPQAIDQFGREETEKIYAELDMLIGNLKTHDVSIDDMFTDLMESIDSHGKDTRGFFETLKESGSIVKAARNIMNKPKQMAVNEKYRRTIVLENIGVIREKLEAIRNELVINVGKLEAMAQNSATQYQNIQYQLVALQQFQIQLDESAKQDAQGELSLMQIDSHIQNTSMQKRINRKMDNLRGVSINAATKAIMARLLAQQNQELASDYDQDLSTLLPELKSLVVTAQANDSLINSADTHNQFVQKMNEMLVTESQRSKEAIQKVQAISSSSVIDVETAKSLTSDVLEVVSSLRKVQQEIRPQNEAFVQVFEEFRANLAKTVNEPDQTIAQSSLNSASVGDTDSSREDSSFVDGYDER